MTLYGDEAPEHAKRWWTWTQLVRAGLKHSYAGTVSKKEIDKRRKANKAARAARRNNR